MSFASILSGPSEEQPTRKPSPPPAPVPTHHAPPPLVHRHIDHSSTGTLHPEHEHRLELHKHMDGPRGPNATNGFTKPVSEYSAPIPRAARRPFPPGVDLEQVNRAAAEIENAEKSDVEDPGFDVEQERYREKGHKRSVESNRAEEIRRKVGLSFFFPFFFFVVLGVPSTHSTG